MFFIVFFAYGQFAYLILGASVRHFQAHSSFYTKAELQNQIIIADGTIQHNYKHHFLTIPTNSWRL